MEGRSLTKSKKRIAEEWKTLTFTEMKGVSERSAKEMQNALTYQKHLLGVKRKRKYP
jgi:hypothetical protein